MLAPLLAFSPISVMTRSQANNSNAGLRGDQRDFFFEFLATQQAMQARLLELLQRQPQAAPQPQVVITPRQQDPNDLCDKFQKRNQLEVTRILNHTHADELMVQIEKIFKVFQCTDKQKVQLAAYMFRNVAKSW